MKTKKYDKLVRDRIPEIIKSNSKECVTKQVFGSEKKKYLYKKLIEETKELIDSGAVEELADIQEVILSLAKEMNVSIKELERVRQEKADRRGGFSNGIVLMETIEKD